MASTIPTQLKHRLHHLSKLPSGKYVSDSLFYENAGIDFAQRFSRGLMGWVVGLLHGHFTGRKHILLLIYTEQVHSLSHV